MRIDFFVVFPVVVVIVAVALAIASVVRGRQRARLRLLAPGDYLFTFTSNGWYQAALLELQRLEIIDPKALTDDSNPVIRGPRWIAASPLGIQIMHGFDADPTLSLPWSKIGEVAEGTRVGGKGRYSSVVSGVSVAVPTVDGDVSLLLGYPSPLRGSKKPTAVCDELNRLRTVPPSTTVV